MLLHKQQSTDGQAPLRVVDSRLKTSTGSGRPSDTCTDETINSVQDMILKD